MFLCHVNSKKHYQTAGRITYKLAHLWFQFFLPSSVRTVTYAFTSSLQTFCKYRAWDLHIWSCCPTNISSFSPYISQFKHIWIQNVQNKRLTFSRYSSYKCRHSENSSWLWPWEGKYCFNGENFSGVGAGAPRRIGCSNPRDFFSSNSPWTPPPGVLGGCDGLSVCGCFLLTWRINGHNFRNVL